MGLLFFKSALQTDIQLMLAITVLTTLFTILGNLLADIGYAMLDPRVRYSLMAMTPHPETAVNPLAAAGTLIAEPPAGQLRRRPAQAKPRSMFRRGWEVFAENKLALVGLGFVIFIILFCFVGPLIYKTQQVSTPLQDAYCTPSAQHLLGCDNLGYDVVGRLMVGGQNSLEVGLAAAFVSCLFGSIYGAVSGFAGGIVDSFMMRIVDAMLSIPFIFVLIILAVLIHPSALTLIGFIAITYWPARPGWCAARRCRCAPASTWPRSRWRAAAVPARCCGT